MITFRRGYAAYRSNYSMSIAVGNEILDWPCWRCSQVVPTDEVGGKIMFCGIRARMSIEGGFSSAICL